MLIDYFKDKYRKLSEKIDVIDVAIFLAIIIALIVAVLTLKNFRQTAGNQIESNSKIMFQVFIRGVTLSGNTNPIIAGEKSFITIRNVPYTSLKVIESNYDSKKVVIPNTKNDGNDFMVAPDFSQVLMYDIIVTFEDDAKITKDGAVIGGNKIKIGLPITLEGQTYKLNGTVSNLRILPNPGQGGFLPVAPMNQEMPQQKQLQPQNKQAAQ